MNQADKIHAIIQTAMGWFSEHLYEFKVHGTSYGLGVIGKFIRENGLD